MPIPFSVFPARQVPPEPAEPRWTVQIHRAGAWPGWRWLDRVLDLNWVGESAVVVLPLMLLPWPSIAVRRLSYWLRRRKDWEVLIYRGGSGNDYRPRSAVRVEVQADRVAAERRAEAIAASLLRDNVIPPSPA